MASTRRLTAILAADVAGYSRLMGADEEGTHERLKAHFQQLFNPKVKEHQGRVVKHTGDGALVEFASVADAVRCAAEIQRAMVDRDAEMPGERRIRFRMGVNLGDVIAEDGDIFGDGVNIAARLEALAEPGGVCISRTVRDQVRDKLPYRFADMGERSVKNIARPVRVYAWRPEAAADLSASSPPLDTATSLPATAPRLSIVVLPFANLSSDAEQQYFADGITEDLTTDLSRLTGMPTGDRMFVISRNTAFTYRDKPVDTKQIGRELGVRYVMEGSVQRSGSRVRVTAQLIDAETGGHLWAERFDRNTNDLFALQSEITGRIASTLSLELVSAEAIRPTDHPEMLDYFFRGRAALNKGPGRETFAEAISLTEHALSLDPRSVEALAGLAAMLAGRVMNGLADSPAADLERSEGLIAQALLLSPRSAAAHFAKAHWLKAQRRHEEAIPEYEVVIALNPNSLLALANLGQCKIFTGSFDEGIAFEEQVLRLSPRDPFNGNRYDAIGMAHLLQSRTDEAIVWLEKGRDLSPRVAFTHGNLAAAYALKGELDRAAAELAEARRLSRDGRYTSIARLRAVSGYESPKSRTFCETTYFAGLRKAGIPEE
jgi:TolB-like protein/Tfp pilus assembly protein PilF